MSDNARPKRILLVTGMSGAGKSVAMNCLEDIGWEAVENLPLGLLDRLLATPQALGTTDSDRPLALGIDSRTRGFDADRIIMRIKQLREIHGHVVETLFLDCSGSELQRRFSETRRRHPMAQDRPVSDGIARERELMGPLRHWAEHVIDTTETSSNELQQRLRARFGGATAEEPTLTVMSFGFARGVPRSADLVFDMRFLRNPHWVEDLRPLSGLDEPVGAYVAQDPAYDQALRQIESLLLLLLPRYRHEGKSYLTIAFGCTGGRHRSVHVAERVAERLRYEGFSPTVAHRDLASTPSDAMEGGPDNGS
ncbi:RNase adapter RapZ [Sphingomonas sp. LaA6.9]|uniref:RNase adapter RapZ n=1 Tax=Sphingomonas sp. LaA6.9 TaxID=2919914 RepID=UPI001F4FC30B|nr:RNase adapter RapZ [Sphingomonas sp. LaA6.9]MCJ8157342.1 RNase adapter RapZ [Sphingomonas sp. LaA6.9]